ncbi:MAG TPA: ABC transporter ATP-binding protein, partial [Myxococcaceae bacterium]|nr:ABC transporter ATP-binding protein [Myxococcaceae bacterium]
MLLVVGAMIVFIALLSHVQSLAQAYLSKRAGEQMAGELRAAMLRQLERISLPYHDGSRSADWIRRIQRDASAIQKLLIDAFIPLVSSAVTLLALSYAMLRLDWELALIVLALSPPLILAARSCRPLLSRQAREVKNLERFTLAVIGEGFGPLRILNASRREERESERFLQRAARGIRARTRARLAERRFELILGVSAATGMAVLVLLGIDHVRASILLLGNFLLLLAYAAKLEKTIQAISGKTVALRGYLAGAERAFALLDQVPAVTEQRPARPIARARGEVAFRGVSLSDDRGQTVLYGVSFELEAGTRVGITGATGAAKSALISLLTRLCDPTDGRILLDGVDIRDYRLDDLRRQFAVVPREPVLSSGSIGENIGSGAPGASRERIVAAALAANAHEFVERLPDGYDTQVGERGVKLSWAKRQAIILARAFLRDSPILILENPPGAVETPTDSATAVALERLKQGRTVIAIGADPSSVAGCAEVLQLKHGRIVGDTARSHFTLRRPSLPGPGASRDAPLDRTRLLAHPAVQAWCRLGPERPLPTRVVPAKFKTHTKRKINVYRLEDVAPAGGSVIAKRCRSTAGAIERLVYEQYLPRLAVPTAGYLGSVEEPAEHGRTWIFTRELTGEPFVNDDPGHRVYAARWLAALHAGAHAIGRHPEIPASDSRRYLEHLRHARELIHTHVNNPILMPEDVALLETLLGRLDDLERGWDRLESWCAGAPQTLVHGDFSSKNIFVNSTGGQPGIVVYDW